MKLVKVLLSAILTLAMSLSLVGCSDTNQVEEVIDVTVTQEQGIRLLSSSETYVGIGYVSKRLTATVYPDNASNMLIEWSVAWRGANSDVVTDYVNVALVSNNTHEAWVYCYKPFNGIISVTATSKDTGAYATCNVTFVGEPTTYKVESYNVIKRSPESANTIKEVYLPDVSYNGKDGLYYYLCDPSADDYYEIKLTYDNIWGQVGSTFSDYSAEISLDYELMPSLQELYDSTGLFFFGMLDYYCVEDGIVFHFHCPTSPYSVEGVESSDFEGPCVMITVKQESLNVEGYVFISIAEYQKVESVSLDNGELTF